MRKDCPEKCNCGDAEMHSYYDGVFGSDFCPAAQNMAQLMLICVKPGYGLKKPLLY